METMGDKRAVVTLPSDTQIRITRHFDAAPELVYKAYTTPELVARWWAGQRGTVRSCEIDLRVGGRWRYVMEANAGFEVAFHGEYQEVVPVKKLVTTEVFEGVPGAEGVTTATFEAEDGGTLLTLLVDHPSREVRDGHINSGMEEGMQESMAALEALVTSGII